MYDLQYVRKRRRRRIAALVSTIASIGVAALVIVSFLGRTVGTFTITVQNSAVRLALSDEETFKNPTSYLRIDDIPSAYYEYSYRWFERDGFSPIDDEHYTSGITKDGTAMYFLKYTFYVKNVGTTTANYNLNINLDESTKATDGQTLDDTLRIMVFENDHNVPDSHKYDIYARDVYDRRYTVYDKEGNVTNRAFVAKTPTPDADRNIYEDDENPLAESFLTNKGKVVIQKQVEHFAKNEVKRYTVVYWLEGEASYSVDINGNPIDPPKGAKIKLSIDVLGESYTDANA